MRITAFADASLRVLMLLNGVDSTGPLSTRSIAEGIGVPFNHVGKVVQRLREMDLLDATRGRAGGLEISPAGREATVGRVLRALDQDEEPAACHTPNGDCPLAGDCRLRSALFRAREAFYAALDGIRIADLPTPRQMGPVLVQLGFGPPATAGN
ncbi:MULTISPECIES: Rrf2 family transcriptional regulator [Arthrobacter]|uniref:Rrf2 family transcriptional regulator n=2 Tax=Arthrobacter TaxID=1663 RepID=A0ABU9KHE5_9MICC|nr:Rrf2 family transcriptional regulator [Arthrobacter sp. YJM1]MDP5226664.1 Rrf2 family transcriptional regulator [Arthrobacter sp. YJM1]